MKFLNSPVKSFNLEITNRCMLKCSGCARTSNPTILKNLKDLDLKKIQNIFSEDQFSGLSVDLCGVYGDSIYHPQFLEIIAFLKSRGFKLNVETNGSYQDKDFWVSLSRLLNSEDSVTFSIDGLEDTNAIYRVNARWEDIMLAIRTLRDSCQLIWKFIVFKHNEHQIESVKKAAANLGMSKVIIKSSGRFHDEDPLTPVNEEFIGVEAYTYQALKTGDRESIEVRPRCQAGKNLGISFDGYLYPCCTASTRTDGWFDENKEFRNLNIRPLKEILNDPKWEELKSLWAGEGCPPICVEYCGIARNKFPVENAELFKSRDRKVQVL